MKTLIICVILCLTGCVSYNPNQPIVYAAPAPVYVAPVFIPAPLYAPIIVYHNGRPYRQYVRVR